MSFLKIYRETQPEQPLIQTTDGDEIARLLNAKGIRFERWQAAQPLAPDADQEMILAAYHAEVERLKRDNGFQSADVISLTPNHPDKQALREKFLSEHTHSEDEVRFFVRGSGVFYLHLEDEVYIVGCAQNDLISVPAGSRHWFDMGSDPDFTCIRLFTNPDGWVAQYTGDAIADRFPKQEELAA